MALSEGQKKVLVAAGAILLGYAGYRLAIKKDTPAEAVKHTVEAPIEATKKAAELIVAIPKKLVKGSAEAKAHMQRLAHMKKGTGRRARAKAAHKGHATKRGLAQDQAMISKEAWEKTYRKDHPRRA